MHYILSPEFHRNLWLRFTPFRLAAAPLALGLIALTCSNAPRETRLHLLMNVSMWVYYIIVILWGNYEAGNALQDEAREKTWDLQRMSSLTPGQLAFGKLFGVTSYVWYFGLLALGTFAYAYADSAPSAHELLRTLFYMVFSGVFGHAAAYLLSLVDMAAGRRGGRPGGRLAFLLGLVLSHYVFGKTVLSVVAPGGLSIFAGSTVFRWFGHDVGWENFLMASMLFFFVWMLTGILRVTRSELMYRMTPAFWALFVATLGLYCAGTKVSEPGGPLLTPSSVSAFFAAALGACYVAMLPEARDVRKYGRLRLCLARRDWRGALENTPRWVASLPLVLLGWGAIFFCGTAAFFVEVSPPVLLTSTLLLALRDICAVHALRFAPDGRQGTFQVLFYYVLAYMLLPALHLMIVGHVIHLPSMNDPSVAVSPVFAWYYPTALTDWTKSLVPPALELAAAGVWFCAVLRRGKNTAGPGGKNIAGPVAVPVVK